MLIFGIDTSCDDTSASVVESGRKIVSNIISNQTEIHKQYGGIVPELASRRHIEMIWPVVDEAMKAAGLSYEDLACIAVCHGPGLIGSLLVGCSFAKALCYAKQIPLVAVNHLEGHVFSPFLEKVRPDYPFIALIVSGGHTCLYRIDGFGKYAKLGRTRDDAAGEAYDTVSKLLGLGYPGGPVIDTLARDGNPGAIDFPRAYLPESLDFSFSGLKPLPLYGFISLCVGLLVFYLLAFQIFPKEQIDEHESEATRGRTSRLADLPGRVNQGFMSLPEFPMEES